MNHDAKLKVFADALEEIASMHGNYAGLAKAVARDALRAAQGIEAGTDETLQAAQPEGQEPGSEGMRPDTAAPSSQDTDQ